MIRVGEVHVEEALEFLPGPHEVCSKLYCETLQSQNYLLRRECA